jgi:uncharacterized membrane protein (UPF0127 family)
VRNVTRKIVLHNKSRIARDMFTQGVGLMFRRPGPDDCLVFVFSPPQPVRFHMMFVFGPIDILALDETGKILALKKDFASWTLWNPRVQTGIRKGELVIASTVVELPPGTIARTGTKVGDRISVSGL